MKKTKFLGVLLFALTIIMSACNNVNDPDPEPEPKPTVGTKDNPYSVAQAMEKQNGEVKWVKGYIVGCVKNGVGSFEKPEEALFSNFDSSTNVFIADDANETDYTKCLSVKLNDTPIVEGLRSSVNLLDNPMNKGKELAIEGAMRSMFTNLKGCRDIVSFIFNTGDKPTENFDVPEMKISELRALWTGTAAQITEKKKIIGVVISDKDGGNTSALRNFVITSTDNSIGLMIRVVETAHDYVLGDKIEIIVEGVELAEYGKALQINKLPLSKTRKIGTSAITPREITIPKLKDNFTDFESTLIQIQGTITSGGVGTWYSGTAAGQNNKITKGTDELVMYVTKYATFKDQAVPTGEKSVTGIAGRFDDTFQLIIRNLNDVK